MASVTAGVSNIADGQLVEVPLIAVFHHDKGTVIDKGFKADLRPQGSGYVIFIVAGADKRSDKRLKGIVERQTADIIVDIPTSLQ